jgi:beta-1,4-mannosyl-glycoprotein beta-1,4-N-acetylglucosaminyltransferase
LTEATTTFSGKAKPLFFEENKKRFKKFEDKIIHQIVEDVPNLNPFERDRFQRDEAKSILENYCSTNDYLIYGDVDEIPSLSALDKAMEYLVEGVEIVHMAQDQYYFYLNVEEVSHTLMSYTGEYPFVINRKWLGTNVSKWEYSKHYSMTDLRDPIHKRVGKRVKNGGWHFTYIGSSDESPVTERVKLKIDSAAHQELNTIEILESVEKNINNLKDIFPRKRTRFKLREDLSFLPSFIQLNLDKFGYLIKK